MSKFKLGDKVVVTNKGKIYSCYDVWALRHGLTKWVEYNHLDNGDTGTVVAIAPHGAEDTTIVAIEKDNKQYMVGEQGVELYVEDTRTPAQKAGLIIGQRYRISLASGSDSAGRIVYFTDDDGSHHPFFGDTASQYCYTPNVKHAELVPDNTTITFNKVLTQAQIDAIKTLVGE